MIRAALLALLLTGCSAAVVPVDPDLPVDGEELPVLSIGGEASSANFSERSGFTRTTRLVVRDRATWTRVWTELHVGVAPVPALPQVDFARVWIVLAAMGERSTGGYTIRIEKITRMRDRIVVTVRSSAPGRNCFTSQALTSPVALSRMAAFDLPVEFREVADTRSC